MSGDAGYDPFARGRFPAGVRTAELWDGDRERRFPCELWYPATAEHGGRDLAVATQDSFAAPPAGATRTAATRRQSAVRDAAAEPGRWPLVVFCHSSGGGRRQSTFLCTHLASHGYLVAALDHSELVAPELFRRADESEAERRDRQRAWMEQRLLDVRFLVDRLLEIPGPGMEADPGRIGIVGHSFGGWTALAAPEVEPRLSAVVALAPAGGANPKPGILAAQLEFLWGRAVPALYLVAEGDVSLPLDGMRELFGRNPAPKRMVVLRRADHLHFMDQPEELHEAVRGMSLPGELSWLPGAMRPIAELCSGDEAQVFVRGLAVSHLDAVLRGSGAARAWLAGDLEGELRLQGVDGWVHAGQRTGVGD